MKMKTKRKALLLSLCAVLLVVASVMGTMAYLTAESATVTNTFTVGNIAITLDEAPVDTNGKQIEGARRTANTYLLVPGQEYKKDPIVHVLANSENSWIFVEVANTLADFEADGNTIAKQISDNGWTAVTGTTNVYYKAYTGNGTAMDYPVFGSFKLSDTANKTGGWGTIQPITIKAYAVQSAGLTVEQAWEVAQKP